MRIQTLLKQICVAVPLAASLHMATCQAVLGAAGWDSNISTGGPNGIAAVIASSGNDVFVATSYQIGAEWVGELWKWNYSGQVWTQLINSSFAGIPHALFFHSGGSLWLGGALESVGDTSQTAAGVARYQLSNATWEAGGASGLQIDGTVKAIGVGQVGVYPIWSRDLFYFGGGFTKAGSANIVRAYTNSSGVWIWESLNGGVTWWGDLNPPPGSDGGSFPVNAISVRNAGVQPSSNIGHEVFIGGNFTNSFTPTSHNINKWSENMDTGANGWYGFGQGLSTLWAGVDVWESRPWTCRVAGLAATSSKVYIVGNFGVVNTSNCPYDCNPPPGTCYGRIGLAEISGSTLRRWNNAPWRAPAMGWSVATLGTTDVYVAGLDSVTTDCSLGDTGYLPAWKFSSSTGWTNLSVSGSPNVDQVATGAQTKVIFRGVDGVVYRWIP